MGSTIEVTIPVESEAAKALETPARREAVGRCLSALLKDGRLATVLSEAVADAKREARASGLTDDDIDAELDAWRAERKAWPSFSTRRHSSPRPSKQTAQAAVRIFVP